MPVRPAENAIETEKVGDGGQRTFPGCLCPSAVQARTEFLHYFLHLAKPRGVCPETRQCPRMSDGRHQRHTANYLCMSAKKRGLCVNQGCRGSAGGQTGASSRSAAISKELRGLGAGWIVTFGPAATRGSREAGRLRAVGIWSAQFPAHGAPGVWRGSAGRLRAWDEVDSRGSKRLQETPKSRPMPTATGALQAARIFGS